MSARTSDRPTDHPIVWSRVVGALVVALALLLAATLSAQAAPAGQAEPATGDPPLCSDFEDLVGGTKYVPGDEFASGPHKYRVRDFTTVGGITTSNHAEVTGAQAAGGSGKDLALNNVNLQLLLDESVAGVIVNAGYYGGDINLTVNGDVRRTSNLKSLDGQIVGGALVRVVQKPGDATKHLVKVSGAVSGYGIGGQELFVDNVCVPNEGAPKQGDVGKLRLQKSIQGDPVEVKPGDVITYIVKVAHEGGDAPMQAAISDTLPTGVMLAGHISVTEVSGSAGPGRAAFGDGSVRWKGGLAPDSALEIAIPVRIMACYGGEARTLTNTVQGRAEGGSPVESSVAVKVACGDVNLDQIKVEVSAEQAQDDHEHDDEGAIDASGVLWHFGPLTATVRGGMLPVRLKIVLTNESSQPVVVGFSLNFEKIEWTYNAQPDDASASVATVSPGTNLLLPAVQAVRLAAGETKTVYQIVDLAGLGLRDVALATESDPYPELEEGLRVQVIYSFEAECNAACRAQDDGKLTRRSHPWFIRWFTQDLGDAPDSSNHYGAAMTAYPGVPARFPTVFDPATGAEQGPRHYHPRPLHLGELVSWEGEADFGPDQDGVNNLRPAADVANLDRFDDGVNPAAWTLQHCEVTRIPVRVFISPQIAALFAQANQKATLNVWIDGNRNGSWRDAVECPPADNLPAAALEHIVIDHPVDVATLGAGLHTLMVPTGRVPWPAGSADRPAWVRVTLSERPSNKALTSFGIAHGDGRGYAKPFRFGETEDYLWRPVGSTTGVDVAVRKQGKLVQLFDAEAGKLVNRVAWTLEYANVGDVTAGNVVLRDHLDGGLNIIAILIGIRAPDGVGHTADEDTLVFPIGALPPGGRGTIVILTEVPEPAVGAASEGATTLVNIAEIRAEGDVNLDNNTARARVDIGVRAPRILTPINGTTCSNDVDVMGKAPAHATVKLYVDGVLASSVEAGAGGRWQTTINLPDGAYSLTATATVGGVESEASPAVKIIVDSLLAWDPISLRFIGPHGHVQQPADADGRLDADGWTIRLRPNTTYTVSVDICCGDANAQVTLSGVSTDTVILTDPEADGAFTGVFTTGPRGTAAADVILTVICSDGETSATGGVELIDPAGVVFDITTGALLADATVACMEAQTSVATGATTFTLWDAALYGQINPQSTAADGYFSFFTPVGTYQVDVQRDGYQPYRSPDLAVISEPVYYDVPLTPVIDEAATVRIEISALGFEPPLVNVPVGAVIEWVNVDVADHSATRLPAEGMAVTAADDPAWDSGALAPGQSYKTRVTGVGMFTYGDRVDASNSGVVIVEEAQVGEERLLLPTIRR